MTARQVFIASVSVLEVNDAQRLALAHAYHQSQEHCEAIYIYADSERREYIRVRDSESQDMPGVPMCIVAPTGDILIPASGE